MTLVLSQVMAKRSKPRPGSLIGTAHLTYRDLARQIPPVTGCAKARYNEPSPTSLQGHVSDMTAAKVNA